MGATITYSDTENRFHDTSKITLDKILQEMNDGGSGSGALVGVGAPNDANGSSGNTYWDTTNKDFYVKDGATWLLLTDIV